MKQYGAFEAKTHFSELLAAVMRGEKYVITKHGAQVAMIVPYTQEQAGIDPVEDLCQSRIHEVPGGL